MEDDFSIEKPRIAKLTGPNYRPWSVQVQRLLVAQGLWSVVSKGQTGTKETEDPARTEVKDARASTIIMGLCGSSTLQHILLLATAKEQWEALKGLYSPLGLQQLGAKLQAFTAYEPPKNASATVTTVATEIDTLQAEIGDIDPKERPSENAKTAVFLRAIRALDPRFDPLILQLEISDSITNKYPIVVTKLTEFERRLGPKEPIREGAFSATGTGKAPKFQGKCFNCGRVGHRKQDCKSPKKSPGNSPSTGPLPTPTGGKGLRIGPTEGAKHAIEHSWAATIESMPYNSPEELLWVIDSGASRHMTYARGAFKEYSPLSEPILIQTANGAEIQAIGQGTVSLRVPLNGTITPVALTEVLYAPGLAGSLISVLQLQDKGITVRTTVKKGQPGGLLIERQGRAIGVATRLGKAYTLKGVLQSPENALKATEEDTTGLWHKRLGHLSSGSLQKLHTATTGLQSPITITKEPCEPCTLAKTVRVINREGSEHVTVPLARLHTDIWGPYSVPSLYGNLYFATFTDEYTRKSWVYASKDRASIRTTFMELKALVELETSLKIQAVRSDNAPEYKALGDHFRPYGLKFEYTTPYFHQQNGVPERLNRTLVTMARAMLQGAKLPEKFWEDAIITASYIRNRTPIGPNGMTPEEAYSGKKPFIGHLRVWGCLAYPHIPLEHRGKMEPTAGKACLIGYMPTSRQYKLYDPIAKKVIVATAPSFREDKCLEHNWEEQLIGEEVTVFDPMETPETPEPEVLTSPEVIREGMPESSDLESSEGTISPGLQEEQEDPKEPEITEVLGNELRRSARTRTLPERY